MLTHSMSMSLCSFSFYLYRTKVKTLRVTQWTFVWILSAVKNIPPGREIINRMGGEIQETPQKLTGRGPLRNPPSTTRSPRKTRRSHLALAPPLPLHLPNLTGEETTPTKALTRPGWGLGETMVAPWRGDEDAEVFNLE
ncbi:hypothetical protein J4Q44_G00017690 [Coregonus suidteri]|uniref:Uncharacterized protein n=1 Tax=Coregonus suidteri TaxID=861788 RepID=A0AAN8MAT5_9TELE